MIKEIFASNWASIVLEKRIVSRPGKVNYNTKVSYQIVIVLSGKMKPERLTISDRRSLARSNK